MCAYMRVCMRACVCAHVCMCVPVCPASSSRMWTMSVSGDPSEIKSLTSSLYTSMYNTLTSLLPLSSLPPPTTPSSLFPLLSYCLLKASKISIALKMIPQESLDGEVRVSLASVYVFPELVCLYASTVQLIPLMKVCTRGNTTAVYNSSYQSMVIKTRRRR